MTDPQLHQSLAHPVIGKLFALITCKLEDAHGPSVSGHHPANVATALEQTRQIMAMIEEIMTLCQAIEAMLKEGNS